MPKVKAKVGATKKTTKIEKAVKLSQKIEKLSDNLENIVEELQTSEAVENQPQETLEIEEIAASPELPVVDEEKNTLRAQKDKLEAEIATLQAQMESRQKEIKIQNYNLSDEQAILNKTKEDIEIITAKNENILKGIEAKNNEVVANLAKVEEATKVARSESDDHFDKVQELLKLEQDTQRSNANLDYLANQARGLIQILRNEFIKYVQMTGLDIKIDCLTEEQKEIIAKTIAPQVVVLDGVEERVYN